MKAVVVGYGSIGQRHARLLKAMNVETAVVSNRAIDFSPAFKDLQEALERFNPEYIVIANKSSDHYAALVQLVESGWKGTVLVEKPLFHEGRQLSIGHDLQIFVAYNLRFHPLLLRLRAAIQQEQIISVACYCGQYLPTWRPDRDYRLSYSSRREEGGGVLRDLSHELDYLSWLFGGWKRLSALGGQYSSLEITGDDTCAILLEMDRCPVVGLQVNYVDRPGRRELLVVTDRHTYKVDFSKGTFHQDDHCESVVVERDVTYIAQHRAILHNRWDELCSVQEGHDVVKMIEAVERAIELKEWILNE